MPIASSIEVKTKRFKVSHEGSSLEMSEAEANQLYESLGKELGRLPFELKSMKCSDRYSHSPHVEFKNGVIYYCTGRSFDAT